MSPRPCSPAQLRTGQRRSSRQQAALRGRGALHRRRSHRRCLSAAPRPPAQLQGQSHHRTRRSRRGRLARPPVQPCSGARPGQQQQPPLATPGALPRCCARRPGPAGWRSSQVRTACKCACCSALSMQKPVSQSPLHRWKGPHCAQGAAKHSAAQHRTAATFQGYAHWLHTMTDAVQVLQRHQQPSLRQSRPAHSHTHSRWAQQPALLLPHRMGTCQSVQLHRQLTHAAAAAAAAAGAQRRSTLQQQLRHCSLPMSRPPFLCIRRQFRSSPAGPASQARRPLPQLAMQPGR